MAILFSVMISSILSILMVGSVTAKVFHTPLISHHEIARRRQQRQLLQGSSGSDIAKQQIDALYQGYGTHYIDLWVGTPPQRQTVVVATGSPKTAFPCSICKTCGDLYHTDAPFLEEASSTYHEAADCKCTYGSCDSSSNQCIMHTSYVEGSEWYGVESTDKTYAGGPHSKLQSLPGVFSDKDEDDADPLRAKNFVFDHTFACMDRTTGLFKTQLADGIMGMDNYPESFWSQAYSAKVIDQKVFALCLSRQENISKMGTEAGALTMGGYDKRLHTSTMVYSKLDPNEEFIVTLKKIYLREGGRGDSVLTNNADLRVEALGIDDDVYNQYHRVTIDSGTTDSYFPYGLNSAFKTLWEELAGRKYHHERIFLTDEELNSLPTILIQLEGHPDLNKDIDKDPSSIPGLAASLDPDNPYDVIIAIPPSHYMQRDGGTGGMYVARYYFDERGYDACVGANTMMGHDVLFDVEEGAMGFAESHCDYTQIEEEVAEEEEAEKGLAVEPTKEKSPVEHDNDYPPLKEYPLDEAVGANTQSSWIGITAAIGVVIGVLGYMTYNRFGGREFSAQRQHGRLPTKEETSDLELELQYVRPIV